MVFFYSLDFSIEQWFSDIFFLEVELVFQTKCYVETDSIKQEKQSCQVERGFFP